MMGTGLTAVYFLLLVNRSFFGRLPDQFTNLPPVHWTERAPSFALATLIVLLGLQPNWLAHWTETTTTAMLPPEATIAIPNPPNPETSLISTESARFRF
jgi:NAD(P)H-quinone oxidoreductase subunit 4